MAAVASADVAVVAVVKIHMALIFVKIDFKNTVRSFTLLSREYSFLNLTKK